MGLPQIAPYAMPTESQLPDNRVSWQCDPDRAVLLIHDMQNHFLRAFPPHGSPMTELVTNIGLLRAAAAKLGIPTVYSAQPGGQTPEQRGLQLDMWGGGIGDDPADAEIIGELSPTDGDIRLTKWRYNAFHRTDLGDILRRHQRDQLIVTGVYAHIGCLLTAADAFMQDLQPFFVADAVGDFSRRHHEMALDYAASRCAMTVPARLLAEQLEGAQV
ncbi:isochorismatase family protein [Amycolatopsis nigrescens]|uniref:isochorismatase family protein n=1 Tax=Amycolatopsis nigrescens TaxID=381445 RepID=UPI00036E5223|nr:isochorismatase family protein [Amycolatopsis nigrescens]